MILFQNSIWNYGGDRVEKGYWESFGEVSLNLCPKLRNIASALMA